jgi:hypothetical protein
VPVKGSLVGSTDEHASGKARRPRLRRSLRGRFAPTSCASSTAASPSPSSRDLAPRLPRGHPTQATRLPSSVSPSTIPTMAGAFLLFALTLSTSGSAPPGGGPAVEQALGQQVSEHVLDPPTVTQPQARHHHVLPVPALSVRQIPSDESRPYRDRGLKRLCPVLRTKSGKKTQRARS